MAIKPKYIEKIPVKFACKYGHTYRVVAADKGVVTLERVRQDGSIDKFQTTEQHIKSMFYWEAFFKIS